MMHNMFIAGALAVAGLQAVGSEIKHHSPRVGLWQGMLNDQPGWPSLRPVAILNA